jgi:Holliday junction resolvase RusA-like endonuclease
MIQAFVPGTPQPQGSKNAYRRGSACVIVETNKNLPKWRKLVTERLEAANSSCEPLEGAVSLTVTFLMPQAKSNKKGLPYQKPDLDKLIRAIGDSATDAGCLSDDSQICQITANKVWALSENNAGVVITLEQYTADVIDK